MNPTDERIRFVASFKTGLFELSELCRQYDISRKTGYKWVERYSSLGIDGLKERSSRPHSCPHQTPEAIRALIIKKRKDRPTWGADKLLVKLKQERPDLAELLPAPSTASAILADAGLTVPRRKGSRRPHSGSGPLAAQEANDVWCADFKGQFCTRDGQLNYPLTVTDAHSRYLLACTSLASVQHYDARPVFERLFTEVGLPKAIRTDNGAPFSSNAICGLSRLSVWWIKLGIRHQRIRPGKPQENGRHERMHRTLKQETMLPPASDRSAQQACFDWFQSDYNHERPHAGIALAVPASLWRPSIVLMPAVLASAEYPGHFLKRSVRRNGCIKWRSKELFISEALHRETLGLVEVDDGIFSFFFYDCLLGKLDIRVNRLVPA